MVKCFLKLDNILADVNGKARIAVPMILNHSLLTLENVTPFMELKKTSPITKYLEQVIIDNSLNFSLKQEK